MRFNEWYGSKDKEMQITSGKAIWSRNKHQYVPLHWVLTKDPEQKLEFVLLACIYLDTSPIDIVKFFVRRCHSGAGE